jgi:tetratricopeptide (TPR) repeat protein
MVVLLLTVVATGQEKENLRAAGYAASQEGSIDSAISRYYSVFEIDSTDYDARLALGRLYLRAEDPDSALYFFEMIYSNDSTDVEALHGMAKSYNAKGMTNRAVDHASKAVRLMQNHVPSYLLLARSLSYHGQIDRARGVYGEVLEIDSTVAEAWAGLGRMDYWESKPYSAKKYYRKAVALDPENTELTEQYTTVCDLLKVRAGVRYQYVYEKEEPYEIDAAIQRYSIKKRLSDHIQLSGNFLLDYSRRSYEQPERADTSRWYDNTWITASWIALNHTITVTGGMSGSDSQISAYGARWIYKTRLRQLGIENTLDAAYTYFYYWNQVGRHTLSEKIGLTYSDFSLALELARGIIDEKPVRKYRSDPYKIDNNPYFSYGATLGYEIIQEPDIAVNITHSYYDFDYYSSEYATPMDRVLTGGSVSVYHRFHSLYIYGMISGNLGTEKFYYSEEDGTGEEKEVSGSIDADNWSASFEAGYTKNSVSISVGTDHFYNPYYRNLVPFLAASVQF